MNNLQSVISENEKSFERFRESSGRTIESLQKKLSEPDPRLESLNNELNRLATENLTLKQKLTEQAKSMEAILESRVKMASEGDIQALKASSTNFK